MKVLLEKGSGGGRGGGGYFTESAEIIYDWEFISLRRPK